ncbi:MAG: DUF5103 domain-containing protein [Flavobacteriaceae bacterium]|nr:DUF5103 domain-containing protein [Flavobacteriaceae bacterium]
MLYLRDMKALKPISLIFFSAFTLLLSNAQALNETTLSENLKSISFKSQDSKQQFPLVQIGETFTLEFDDLLAQENDYYYTISYYNHDWTPSSLFKNEFLEGYDNLRITNIQSSFGTLQRYTHYKLILPNENTQFKISGNYLLSIYNSSDELMFTRKFLIYRNLASIQAGVFRSRELEQYMSNQTIQFSIKPVGFNLRNQNKDLKVIILQNDQWDVQKIITKPQYVIGRELHFRYDSPLQFEGGNEFLYLDTKDSRVVNPSISHVELDDIYQTYLFTDPERKNYPYTLNPDINGDFEINTVQGANPDIESDYTQVYFSLAKQYTLQEEEIYLYGKFTNYEIKDEYKLTYNPSYEVYEGTWLIKQGFYNYKYVWKSDGVLDKNRISGSHAATENQYLILAYTRLIGTQHDALIAKERISSFEIEN